MTIVIQPATPSRPRPGRGIKGEVSSPRQNMNATIESIWNNVSSQLRAFIRSRVRDHAAAEDILQDVFLRIHRKLPTVRASERLEAWVWRITRNAIADHFRKLRPSEPLLDGFAPASEKAADLPDLRPCVRQFVNQLQPASREALLLTEWQGLTQNQMATRLGLSLSGAKSRVQRARDQLKKLLLDCCRFELDRRGNILEMHPRRQKCRAC
jgi:RNA polymerase sigma-70 factor (ECF subfamily)